MRTCFQKFVFLSLVMMLTVAACRVEPPPGYGNEETSEETNSNALGTTTSASAKKDAGSGSNAASGSDAQRNTESADAGEAPDSALSTARDAGRSNSTRPDSAVSPDSSARGSSTPDASQPDAAAPTPAWIFATPEFGTLVTTTRDTTVSRMTPPAWAEHAVAAASFTRPNGSRYTLLIYAKGETESFEHWLANSEVGDAAVSEQRIQTANDNFAFVYATNDFGAVPDVHITVPTRRFVYYFHADSDSFDVPEDFINFVQETEVQ